MRISEKKSLQLNSFNNIIIEVCWMEGLIEVKTKKNLNLFYETITNNKDLINSVLKKIDCSLLNRGVLVLKEIKMNFFKTKVLLEFNASFLNDDPIVKMIELILKIDVEKDTEMIAEILLNNGKEGKIIIPKEYKTDVQYGTNLKTICAVLNLIAGYIVITILNIVCVICWVVSLILHIKSMRY